MILALHLGVWTKYDIDGNVMIIIFYWLNIKIESLVLAIIIYLFYWLDAVFNYK